MLMQKQKRMETIQEEEDYWNLESLVPFRKIYKGIQLQRQDIDWN